MRITLKWLKRIENTKIETDFLKFLSNIENKSKLQLEFYSKKEIKQNKLYFHYFGRKK